MGTLILIISLSATQYPIFSGNYNYSVSSQYAKIQFMAYDYAPLEPSSYVISNAGLTCSISLGKITEYDSKTYPAAFAIVNCEQKHLRLTKIEITGSGASQISVYAHKDPRKPCNSHANTYGSMTMENLGSDEGIFESGDSALRYVSAGSSDDNYNDGLVLGKGLDYTTSLRYTVDNSVTYDEGTWDSSKNIWVHDATPSNTYDIASTLTNDETSQSNFLWIEIDIYVPQNSGTLTFSDIKLYFYFREVSS